jgi:AcrR family transcriptional regulator
MASVRVPQQSRSKALVARVLQAAGELFATEGYEQTTTNRIAAAAGVSVGSLYQFFVDKHAILDALQAEWSERLTTELDKSLDVADSRPHETVVDEVLEVHARLDREQPGLLAVLLTRGGSGVNTARAAIQLRLEQIIASREPRMPEAQRRIAAAMLIQLSLGLYTVPRSMDPDRTATRAEVRRALVAYLHAIERGDPA